MVSVEEASAWALGLPGTVQSPHFDKISFRIKKKIFATLDAKTNRLVVKLSVVDQSVFCGYDLAVIHPATGAWGKQGWTVIELPKIRKTICLDAIKTSYQTVSAKK